MQGISLGGMVAGLALSLALPAAADSIWLGQFGPDGASLDNQVTGVTRDGVGFTLTGPGDGFTAFQEGNDWSGQFDNGAIVLWNNIFNHSIANPVDTITFDSPLSSLSMLSAQPSLTGGYEATMRIYTGPANAPVLLKTLSYASDNELGPEGSVPGFDSYVAPPGDGITEVVILTTNASAGFAIGGDVPEPAAWALMLAGFAALGGALRSRRRPVPALV